ncbi:MAG: HlyC/CorC family transporter [Candidatus Levybacteria bacterium]|nr:HlyC/CorC family transporter [Candidatus Levybacteria bacterium]
MDVIPQLLFLIFLVFLNGFFVASEFALVGVRKTRIDELVKEGNQTAVLVQKSLKNLDTFISATQLGITIASLGLGWVGEPFLARLIEPSLQSFLPNGVVSLSAHGLSFAIAFSAITFLHIVLGELAPKSIALQRAEKTSFLIITPLSIFTTIFKPFIFILNGAGILVLKAIGFKAPSGHQLVHSEEEIKMILAQSAQEGAIEKEEAEMVYSVLRLGDTPVEKIMVPKERVIAFERSTPLKEVIKTLQQNPHSRFPIYERTIDNVVGFIHIKDVFRNLVSQPKIELIKDLYRTFVLRNRDKTLGELGIIRSLPKVFGSEKIDDVMLMMRARRIHMAAVRNEKGQTQGIVTLEDAVESLVGEIHDEFEILKEGQSGIEKVKKLTSFIKRQI